MEQPRTSSSTPLPKKKIKKLKTPAAIWDKTKIFLFFIHYKKKFAWSRQGHLYKIFFLQPSKKIYLHRVGWDTSIKKLQLSKISLATIKDFFETIKNFHRNYKKIFLETIKKMLFLTFFFLFFLFFLFFFFLSGHSIRMVNLTRKKNSTNTKKRVILRLLSAPARYINVK